MHTRMFVVVVAIISLCGSAQAEHTWVLPYQSTEDSPFLAFSLPGSLSIENFEDGEVNVPGVTLSPPSDVQEGDIFVSSTTSLSMANSIGQDTGNPATGSFLLGVPKICAATYPLLCPATATLEFGGDELPTVVGFVWTDAVRSSNPMSGLPFAVATAFSPGGDIQVERVFDLPALDPDDTTSDDLFIGFVDYRGIERLTFNVVTDREGGYLAMDHLQFGNAAEPGDTNLDGAVDFADFLMLAEHFGEQGDWSAGDSNFDGIVEFADFLQLANNFEGQAIAASVPEPASFSIAVGMLFISAFFRLRRHPVDEAC